MVAARTVATSVQRAGAILPDFVTATPHIVPEPLCGEWERIDLRVIRWFVGVYWDHTIHIFHRREEIEKVLLTSSDVSRLEDLLSALSGVATQFHLSKNLFVLPACIVLRM
jgi:hypothetical protein